MWSFVNDKGNKQWIWRACGNQIQAIALTTHHQTGSKGGDRHGDASKGSADGLLCQVYFEGCWCAERANILQNKLDTVPGRRGFRVASELRSRT
jgi:hypothetical protein